MKIIKLAFISIFVVFVIITAISLMFPSNVRISKATNLPNHKDSVFALVKNHANWEKWNPVYQDSALKQQWEHLQITSIANTDSNYVLQLQQEGRKPVISGWQIYHYPSSDSLTLQWYMDFKLSWYPWEKFSSMLYEKTYGRMMEQGLTNIKGLLNKE
ncbi:MAG: hypothetical protein ACM3VS_02575 [Candidatus Dadabacteria bacterium]